MRAQIGNSLIHTTQAHTLTHTHTQRARPDQRLPFGWTWQWFWNVDNCQIKITQAISQAQIWMQVSEQKEIATGDCPSDFTIDHSVSCALWNEATERWGRSASDLEIISSHTCLDLPEGNALVLYQNVQIRSLVVFVCFLFISPQLLPKLLTRFSHVPSENISVFWWGWDRGEGGARSFSGSLTCRVLPVWSRWSVVLLPIGLATMFNIYCLPFLEQRVRRLAVGQRRRSQDSVLQGVWLLPPWQGALGRGSWCIRVKHLFSWVTVFTRIDSRIGSLSYFTGNFFFGRVGW